MMTLELLQPKQATEPEESFPVSTTNQGAVAFIDPSLKDYRTLIAALKPETQAILLEPNRDGVAQITQILQIADIADILDESSDITSLHIISHGTPGAIKLGNSELNLENIDQYKKALQSWLPKSVKAPIFLYGCHIAAGEKGQAFIQRLSQLTGQEIAASAKPTGHPAFGGDWQLEVTTGEIPGQIAFEPEIVQYYQGILNPSELDSTSTSTSYYQQSMDNTNALIDKYLNMINGVDDEDSDVADDDEIGDDLTTTTSTSDYQQSIDNANALTDNYLNIIDDSGLADDPNYQTSMATWMADQILDRSSFSSIYDDDLDDSDEPYDYWSSSYSDSDYVLDSNDDIGVDSTDSPLISQTNDPSDKYMGIIQDSDDSNSGVNTIVPNSPLMSPINDSIQKNITLIDSFADGNSNVVSNNNGESGINSTPSIPNFQNWPSTTTSPYQQSMSNSNGLIQKYISTIEDSGGQVSAMPFMSGILAPEKFQDRLCRYGLSGSAIDGYIEGSQVFLDANKNGVLDDNEPTAITDANGAFNMDVDLALFDTNENGLLDPEEGQLVATGGTDTATGLPLETPAKAPVNSLAIAVLTSLVNDLVNQGMNLNEANQQVTNALGIPSGVDLTNLDPIAATNNNVIGGAETLSAMVQVQNVITQTMNLIKGAGSASNATITEAVVAAVANQIQTGGTLNLTDATQLQAIVEDAADRVQAQDASLDMESLTDIVSEAATVMAESNQQINSVAENTANADLAEEIAQVQKVTLGETSDDLLAAAAGTKSIEDVVAENTGEALESKIFGQSPATDDSTSETQSSATDDVTVNNATGNDATVNNATGNDATVNNATGNNATVNNATGNDATGNNATGNDATGNNATGNDATGNNVTGNDVTGNDATGNNATANDVTGNDVTGNDVTGNDVTGNDATESTNILPVGPAPVASNDPILPSGPIITANVELVNSEAPVDTYEEGTDNDDTFTGDVNHNSFLGRSGNDDLSGLEGNDWMNGNRGFDTLDGGDGDDFLNGNQEEDTVLQHLDKAIQNWILLDIIRIASCFTLAVSALNQSTGLKSDASRPTQRL